MANVRQGAPVSGLHPLQVSSLRCNKMRRHEIKNDDAATRIQKTMESLRQMVTWFYPDLDKRAYFLPPVYFNRECFKQTSVGGLSVLITETPPDSVSRRRQPPPTPSQSQQPQQSLYNSQASPPPRALWPLQNREGEQQLISYSDSHVREDVAQQHVLHCLNALASDSQEVMFVISQLAFSDYFNQPCYAAAAGLVPRSAGMAPQYRRGDFDLLVIHRHHGVLVAEIKAVGLNANELNKSVQEADTDIAKRVGKALKQLNKSEAVIRHLTSDVAPILPVRKTLILPYIARTQLMRMLAAHHDLEQKLCKCLGATDPINARELCMCSDDMTARETPWEVTNDVITNLRGWWRRVMAVGTDLNMTSALHLELVARFGGPATTVNIHGIFPPRLEVRTEGQAVSETGERIIRLVLTPDQLRLLHLATPRVFLTGPPGTGKTVVMVLMGLQWLRQGHDVLVLGVDEYSRAASHLIYRQLQATLRADPSVTSALGTPRLLLYDFLKNEADTDHALQTLTEAMASAQTLHVLCDEFTPDIRDGERYQKFVNDLMARVPNLHLWTAGLWNNNAPSGLQLEPLTVPLRCAPVIQREVEKGFIRVTASSLYNYSASAAPTPCDGPSIIRLNHQGPGHTAELPVDCEQCGVEIATVLTRHLQVGAQVPNSSSSNIGAATSPPPLQYRDVMVFVRAVLHDDASKQGDAKDHPGCTPLVRGLRHAGLPVKVLRNGQDSDWQQDVHDVALGQHDHITVANYRDVSGLERKVVVWVPGRLRERDDKRSDDDLEARGRLYAISRCTAQLVVVQLPSEDARHCRNADVSPCHIKLTECQQIGLLPTPEA